MTAAHTRSAAVGAAILATVVSTGAAAASRKLDRTLKLQGVTFRVVCANQGSANRLEIRASGLAKSVKPIVREIGGTVTGAEVADLDANGYPEIYVYVASAGSGSYGSVVGYAANRRKSLTEIYLAPITDDAKASKGYMGHDEFTVSEGALLRRFPVYKDGDANAAPTGGKRQVQYKLVAGEAGWVLKPDGIVEFGF
jgi:hypothetical protein